MKKKEWLKAMSFADEKYVAESDPATQKKTKWLKPSVIAACLCVFFTAALLYLFIPYNNNNSYPNISQYIQSEYYPLIEKLNHLAYAKDSANYKNNFEKLIGKIDEIVTTNRDLTKPIVNEVPPQPNYNSGSEQNLYPSYPSLEITDNQVTGVAEGDCIKRSDKYIYYLDQTSLYVYSIEGASSRLISSYDINLDEAVNVYKYEFYLSADFKTITLIKSFYANFPTDFIKIISLDVTDPYNITEKNSATIAGGYTASRIAQGKLLLLTVNRVNLINMDFSDESTFVPYVEYANGNKTCVPADNIIIPDKTTSHYTTAFILDENTLNIDDSFAFLSYCDVVYVSKENIYVSKTLSSFLNGKRKTTITEISCLGYANSEFNYKGTINVDGVLNNQYSLDEYDGVLRVVTTSYIYGSEYIIRTSASLYCIDLAEWEIAAQVINFAPLGESVRSVRFDKNTAYVCTAINVTDPVFFFDLSDINNITYKHTGTIEGFSTSLVNFNNGFLLGIGRGSISDLKIEIYKEDSDSVLSVCKYELYNVYYSSDYKSYYIDRENQLIGLAVTEYSTNETIYILLMFDGYNLTELVNAPSSGHAKDQRAVFIDDYLYIFGTHGFFCVQKIF